MKTQTTFVALCSVVFGVLGVRAQGTFRNLNFELAQVPAGATSGSFIPANAALPFWTAYLGSSQQSTVLYDALSLGNAVITLQDAHSVVASVIEGNYTPVLQAGFGASAGNASIAQTGIIPVGTKSLIFTASTPQGTAGWEVTVGNLRIPVVETSQVTPSIFVYAGDISAFAGQTEELRFTAFNGPGAPTNLSLDAIQFSPFAVPEPTIPTLLLVGGMVFAYRIFWRVR